MRRRLLVAGAVAMVLGAGVVQASASSDIGWVPIDETPISEVNDGEQGGQIVSAGREQPRADGLELVAGCHYETTGKPNTSETMLLVTAEASATSLVTAYGVPVSVGVTCSVHRVRNGTVGESVVTLSKSAAGTTVAAAKETVVGALTNESRIRYGEFTVCTAISAHFNSDTFVRTETRCVQHAEDITPA